MTFVKEKWKLFLGSGHDGEFTLFLVLNVPVVLGAFVKHNRANIYRTSTTVQTTILRTLNVGYFLLYLPFELGICIMSIL